MDLGLIFFADSPAVEADCYGLLLAAARFADTHGFSAVWTPERHFHSFGGQYPNPAVIGAALATATSRVHIRAGSVVAPLHHPIRIAEEWSVVDNLSGGRTGVSFASGWHSVDFVFNPEAYQDRKRVMTEAVATVRKLWRGEEVEFAGPEATHAVRIHPAPIQPDLPIWITAAGSPETFRLAGRLGAGVLTHQLGQEHEALERNIAAYRAELAAAHGDGARGHVALMLHTLLGPDRDTVRGLVHGPLLEYLRSSMSLSMLAPAGTEPGGFDLTRISEQDREFLLERAFERHFGTSGLFGSVEDAAESARRLAAIGVDEIACLIDFGVARDEVLRSLDRLGDLVPLVAGVGAAVPAGTR